MFETYMIKKDNGKKLHCWGYEKYCLVFPYLIQDLNDNLISPIGFPLYTCTGDYSCFENSTAY